MTVSVATAVAAAEPDQLIDGGITLRVEISDLTECVGACGQLAATGGVFDHLAWLVALGGAAIAGGILAITLRRRTARVMTMD